MRTIILNKPGEFSLNDSARPQQPKANEALVRVHRIGICGTDLHAFKGDQPFFTYPRVLGHELGVEIISVPNNSQGLREGDRCAVEPYLNCGTCIACRLGKTNCCVELQVLGVHADGGMRQFITVPLTKLHKSATLSLDELALVEPLCVGAHAVGRAQVQAGELALVVGAGPIGLSVIQFALHARAKVLVMDTNEQRLDFAARHFSGGSIATIQAGEGALERIQELTSQDMSTLVFDATGNQHSMNASFRFVAHGGRLVFVGLFQGDITFHDPEAHRRELTLLCSRNATAADFKRVIAALESGKVNVNPWVTHRVSFGEQFIGEFPRWLDPQSRFIKAVVEV